MKNGRTDAVAVVSASLLGLAFVIPLYTTQQQTYGPWSPIQLVEFC